MRYLSILKNPCCPNFLEEQAGKDLHDYQLYRCALRPAVASSAIRVTERRSRHCRRYTVLHKLQGLKFLDFQPVKDAERAEAKKRGQFTAVARPSDDGGGAEGEEAEVMAPCRPAKAPRSPHSGASGGRWRPP